MESGKDIQINIKQLGERAHKITEALYRVTGLFSEKEPLKWQLRANAIEIFDFLSSLEDGIFFDPAPVLASINKISRGLQLAFSSSAYFSSINFDILRREYLLLAEEIGQVQSPLKLESAKEPLAISNGHLSTNGHISNGQKNVHNTPNGHNGQTLKEIGSPNGDAISSSTKETEFPGFRNSVSNSNSKRSLAPFTLKGRQKEILSLISAKGGSASGGKENNGWMNINEIAAFLPKYGKKSIQRDLLEMTEIGILKKTGDKRWRKYIPTEMF